MADPNNTNYLYTLGGYATLIGIGYALYHVSSQKAGRRSVANGTRASKTPHQEPRKEDRKKKQRMESFVSETQGGSRASTRHKSAADVGSSLSSSAAADTADDDVDNKEFAKQLAKAKEGTKLAATAETSKLREKSVKQSRANQMLDDFSEDKPSTASSTTGADGDVDEQSVPISPETAAADASGVADMLEPTPAGPSILRITGSEGEKAKAKAAPRAREQTETKKQRQNRKKAEAAKALREEAEEKRKVLEEGQRRQARIAEGRAAKDGSQFMAATAANSVWTQGATNGNRAQAAHAGALQQPLDTFERASRESASKQAAAVSSDSSWISSLPSEEEQMEMLKVEADEWSTVQTKAAKKAAKKASSVSSEDKAPAQAPAQSQAKQQPSAGKTKTSKTSAAAHPFGSFSALTTKDNGADDGQEEEDEEEWDV